MTLRVLNAGFGGVPVPDYVLAGQWRTEVTLDADPECRPDVVASLVNVGLIDSVFDVVWCAHALEHLAAHEVPVALKEFRRVLVPGGAILLSMPDLRQVAEQIVKKGLTAVAYTGGMGPISARDMLYGHGREIAKGRWAWQHRTGFTAESLGVALTEAGFEQAQVQPDDVYNLWARAYKPRV